MSTQVQTSHSPRTRTLAPRSRAISATLLGALMLATAGCAGGFGANSVDRGAVRQASTVRTGVVTSAREVTIRGNDRNNIGTGAGAVIGGLAGSQVGGRGSTQAIGAIGGAVLGGLAGNAASKAIGSSRGVAYVVQFENGESREIVQGADVFIQPGTPVNVIFRADGAIVTPQG